MLKTKKSLESIISDNTSSLKEICEAYTFCFTGVGPHDPSELKRLIPDFTKFIVTDSDTLTYPDRPQVSNTCYVIGSDFYNETEIEHYVRSYGHLVKILPQEGFIDLVLFGNDWWLDQTDKLNDCLEHHPGLQYAKSLAGTQIYDFKWPSVKPFTFDLLSEPTQEDVKYKPDSCLSRHGYKHKIGGKDLTDAQLIKALDKAIEAEGLEACVRHMHRLRTRRISWGQPEACKKWDAHLAYMKEEYYDVRNYGFMWPE